MKLTPRALEEAVGNSNVTEVLSPEDISKLLPPKPKPKVEPKYSPSNTYSTAESKGSYASGGVDFGNLFENLWGDDDLEDAGNGFTLEWDKSSEVPTATIYKGDYIAGILVEEGNGSSWSTDWDEILHDSKNEALEHIKKNYEEL